MTVEELQSIESSFAANVSLTLVMLQTAEIKGGDTIAIKAKLYQLNRDFLDQRNKFIEEVERQALAAAENF